MTRVWTQENEEKFQKLLRLRRKRTYSIISLSNPLAVNRLCAIVIGSGQSWENYLSYTLPDQVLADLNEITSE